MSDRKEILKLWNEAQEQFDKQLIYLSGGALVLSMGFVKDIVTITEETNTCSLICAWILFTLSLVFNLFSHKTSHYSMHFELAEKEKASDVFNVVTEVLNWLSFVSLIIGIVSFISFVNHNI